MRLVLYKPKTIDGETVIQESIYTTPFASGRHFRKLMEFDETINYTDMSIEEVDKVVGFVCDVYGNQFTIDEFYDGIPGHKVISTAIDVFAFVRTGKTPEQIKTESEANSSQITGKP